MADDLLQLTPGADIDIVENTVGHTLTVAVKVGRFVREADHASASAGKGAAKMAWSALQGDIPGTAGAALHALTVPLFTDIAALQVPSRMQTLRTAGYHQAGVGGALYVRTETTGATVYRTQSADGAWWQLAEAEPDAYMVGAVADATTGTPTDQSATLNALASAGLNRHSLRIGDNYDLATSTGGFQVGAETVLLPYDRSLRGEGWATKVLAAAEPAVSVLFACNTNGAGAWVHPFPGELNSKIGEFYIDGRPAAGTPLVAFQFAGSYHFTDIHALGINTVLQQINQYCDLVTVERITIAEQPDDTQWAVDLKWAGDAVRVDQLHSFRKPYTDPAEARACKSLRLRYKNGATVTNIINGDILIEGCGAVHLSSLHMEDGVVTFQESGGTLSDALFWMRGDALGLSAVPLRATYGDYTSLHPGALQFSDVGFVYQQSFPYGYSVTKHNFELKTSPFPYTGHVRVERLCRVTKPEGGLASLGQKYGVTCGDEDFDNYSHFASVASEWRDSRWHISAEVGDLPFTDAVIDSATSTTGPDYVFSGATATYHYRGQVLLDKVRKIGISGDTDVSLVGTNGGNSPVLVLTDAVRVGAMFRFYRGPANNSYDYYVDVPLIAGARFVDTGADVGGYPWIARAAGPVDALNAGSPATFRLSPGSSLEPNDAYGHVEVLVRSNAAIPTVGTWRYGDKWELIVPTTDGFQLFRGWIRLTNGSGHVDGVDWARECSVIKDPIASSAQFTTASVDINAKFKNAGRLVTDSTSGRIVRASGSAPTDVWLWTDGATAGTTAYTPV